MEALSNILLGIATRIVVVLTFYFVMKKMKLVKGKVSNKTVFGGISARYSFPLMVMTLLQYWNDTGTPKLFIVGLFINDILIELKLLTNKQTMLRVGNLVGKLKYRINKLLKISNKKKTIRIPASKVTWNTK